MSPKYMIDDRVRVAGGLLNGKFGVVGYVRPQMYLSLIVGYQYGVLVSVLRNGQWARIILEFPEACLADH